MHLSQKGTNKLLRKAKKVTGQEIQLSVKPPTAYKPTKTYLAPKSLGAKAKPSS
jgi:hypothetical protein